MEAFEVWNWHQICRFELVFPVLEMYTPLQYCSSYVDAKKHPLQFLWVKDGEVLGTTVVTTNWDKYFSKFQFPISFSVARKRSQEEWRVSYAYLSSQLTFNQNLIHSTPYSEPFHWSTNLAKDPAICGIDCIMWSSPTTSTSTYA